jgi:hypothetical protein
MRFIHRRLQVLIGVIAVLAGGSVEAGGITVLNCSGCSTTTNFVATAENQSLIDQQNKLYVMPSDSNGMTAYIRVRGAWTNTREPMWYVTGAEPVDANAVTLASQGYTETQKQNYYAGTDQINFNSNRYTPAAVDEGLVTIPQNLPQLTGFTSSSDGDVSVVIDSMWPAIANNAQGGSIILFKFNDGTSAQYYYTGTITNGYKNWAWNGFAWDKNGNRIDRNGNFVYPLATTGAGGGSVRSYAFGADANGFGYQWLMALSQSTFCYITTTVYWGSDTSTYAAFVPCN